MIYSRKEVNLTKDEKCDNSYHTDRFNVAGVTQSTGLATGILIDTSIVLDGYLEIGEVDALR